jgi:acetolactate synthase I/II/III large subunit
VVKMLEDMEVQYAFGVSGGAIAPSSTHCNIVQSKYFTFVAKTELGIANALTELFTARWEGAKVIIPEQ